MENNINLHILFIDFIQVFNNINISKVKVALEILGVPMKLSNLNTMSVEESKAQVNVDYQLSDPFIINK